MKTDLVKNSPLIGIYDKNKVQLKNYKGWMLPNIFKSLKDEKASLSKASVLADWSCIGKFHLRGKTAAKFADSLVAGASKIKIGTALVKTDYCALKLLKDRFLILCGPDKEAATEEKLRKAKAPYNNVTGAWGCLALAGKEKSQVLDRSAAMNLTESKYLAGSVIQSSVHTITTTIYRSKKADLLICDRAYTEALFDAFMDVGKKGNPHSKNLSFSKVSMHSSLLLPKLCLFLFC